MSDEDELDLWFERRSRNRHESGFNPIEKKKIETALIRIQKKYRQVPDKKWSMVPKRKFKK